jgi:transposase
MRPSFQRSGTRLFFAEHFKVGTICSQLNVHPDVVNRVIGQMGRPPANREPKPDMVETYKPFIGQILLSYPRLTATRIFDMICDRGYLGSVRTLRRYVTEVRPRMCLDLYIHSTRQPCAISERN